ncbi:MAG TPA: Sua5/YciO/YrdC/YwlC family protein [Candidatus Thermoplasmatota archaeon]
MVRKIVSCQDSRAEVAREGCHCGAAAQYEQALRNGLIVLSDTESVPGLHAWLEREDAMARMTRFKGRPQSQFIYLFADVDSMAYLADFVDVSPRAIERLLSLLKTPLTLVFPDHDDDNPGTVAVRVCEHPFLGPVLRHVYPVASTSANVPGAPPPESMRDVAAQAREVADVEVRIPIPSAGVPSAVVDFSVRPVVVRRRGRLNEVELRSTLKAAGLPT